jgi:hypothetical protein
VISLSEDRDHEFLGNDGTLEAAQRVLAMPIAGSQSFMTAVGRRVCSKIWSGLDIGDLKLHESTAGIAHSVAGNLGHPGDVR